MNETSGNNINGEPFPNLNIYDPNKLGYSNYRVIGVCSICGGDVTIFDGPWGGMQPPVASCASCGAIRQEDRGPVIPMVPRWPRRPNDQYWLLKPTDPVCLAIYQVEQEGIDASVQPNSEMYFD